jgi:hypothetical protein
MQARAISNRTVSRYRGFWHRIDRDTRDDLVRGECFAVATLADATFTSDELMQLYRDVTATGLLDL